MINRYVQDKIKECYKVKHWIKNTAFKLRNIDQIRGVLRKQSHTKRADFFKVTVIFAKSSIWNIRLGSKYML